MKSLTALAFLLWSPAAFSSPTYQEDVASCQFSWKETSRYEVDVTAICEGSVKNPHLVLGILAGAQGWDVYDSNATNPIPAVIHAWVYHGRLLLK